MTASQIARTLHGVKAGKRWQCKCPVSRMHQHGDRNRSLSIGESDDGWVMLKCFAGCSRTEILEAMGLQIRDLALNEFRKNPQWEQQKSDRERLDILERRHGLFIMLQAVEPGKRNYWRAAERNTAVEIRELRTIIFPVEEYYRRRNETAQYLISEYGIPTLMECVEWPNLRQNPVQ